MNSYMLDFLEMLTLARLAWNAMFFYDERWLGLINPNEENNYSVEIWILAYIIFDWVDSSIGYAC